MSFSSSRSEKLHDLPCRLPRVDAHTLTNIHLTKGPGRVSRRVPLPFVVRPDGAPEGPCTRTHASQLVSANSGFSSRVFWLSPVRARPVQSNPASSTCRHEWLSTHPIVRVTERHCGKFETKVPYVRYSCISCIENRTRVLWPSTNADPTGPQP